METHINVILDVQREAATNETESVVVTVHRHSAPPDEITGFTSGTSVGTVSFIYEIPEGQKTSVEIGEPHIHDNELTYQALYRTWLDAITASAEYAAAVETLCAD